MIIKKGNKVKILTGKDKNKEGEIIECKPFSKNKKFQVMDGSKWYRYKLNY